MVGWTKQEVLDVLTRAKALLKEGKTVMTYTATGTSVGKQFTMPVADVVEECGYALQVLDPDSYPKRRRYLTSNYFTRTTL